MSRTLNIFPPPQKALMTTKCIDLMDALGETHSTVGGELSPEDVPILNAIKAITRSPEDKEAIQRIIDLICEIGTLSFSVHH